MFSSHSSTHPLHVPPSPYRGERARRGHVRRGTGQQPPPPPPPSPTWAEILRGGSSRGERQRSDHTQAQPTAAASNSTPAGHTQTYTDTGSNPLPPPSAHSQYLAWVCCRREGIPARLVLETDGVIEDVCLWFRPFAVGATDVNAHTPPSGKRRRERARRIRRREERRKETEENQLPSNTPTTGEATTAATIPSTLPPDMLPSSGTPPLPETTPTSTDTPAARAHVYKARPLPAKKVKTALTASRASKRAAVLARKRGTAAVRRSTSAPDDDASTPERLRCANDETASLEITMPYPSTPPQHLSLPPPTPPMPSTPSFSVPPPPPPPMHSKFPTYYRRVICQECFYDDHDYRYYHCLDCHQNGPPCEEARLRNLRRFAVIS